MVVRMPRQWVLVLGATLALAMVSLASNITTDAQLIGDADAVLTARLTVSKLANSGTAWAGLGVLAGWLIRRPALAFGAGIGASALALAAHYAAGQIIGVFEPEIWSSNAMWFVAALVAGGPLGVVGATARRTDVLGLLARLVVPFAAGAEPFVGGMLTPAAAVPGPHRIAGLASGSIMVAAGAVALCLVLARRRRR